MNKRYSFQWEAIGDIVSGRPQLGSMTYVSVYRLLQYTMKDVLELECGQDKAKELFLKAGLLAGREFCKNMLDKTASFSIFIKQLQILLSELKIGILQVEMMDVKEHSFVLTLTEDLDSAGIPAAGEPLYDYAIGLIAGIFEEYTGKPFKAKEQDSWENGERICRFFVKRID